MTSSLRATVGASVRQTPGAAVAGAAAWSLTDLSAAATASGSNAAAMSAEERAALIEEGYASGYADGQKHGTEAAQARVSQALALIDKITVDVQATASLAPSMLDENVAALAVIVARQIVAREVATSSEVIADLV